MDSYRWDDFRETAERLISWALEEDAAFFDVTTGALGPGGSAVSSCLVVAREELVLAGWPLLEITYGMISGSTVTESSVREGSRVEPGTVLGRVSGEAGHILMGERVALNMLCRLSGIASLTARYVDAVRGTGTEILDTRKTTPCHRILERYAVAAGGGVNHRFSLASMALIKDNHIAALGGAGNLASMVGILRDRGTGIEIEVDSPDQIGTVLELGPDRIMLDNMSTDQMREAVAMCRGSGCYLEASGGITLETVRSVAETGVDGISVGSLTHSAAASDIGFDWEDHDQTGDRCR